MEKDPSDENVSYMDEYPELQKKVWLRRLNQERQVGRTAVTHIYQFPTVTEIPRRNPDVPDQPA